MRATLNHDPEYQKEVSKNTLEYKREVKRLIEETEAKAREEGNLLLAEAGDMAYRTDMSAWDEEGADLKAPNSVTQIVKAIQKQTQSELKNITKSTAFKGTVFETTGVYNAYRRELDMAVMKIGTGTFSSEQAIKDCVHRLAQSGLRSIDYTSNGKQRAYQLDTSVRMCLRTAINQLSGKIQEDNMKKFETPLVYVDAHAGARPEHAVWQGKVYAYNPDGILKDGSRAGDKYDDFFSETDYGSVTGLMGVNCQHHWYPYHEGDPIPEFKEPQPVTINGKEYTYYEATQEMRKQERKIRETKREIEATKALSGDARQLRAKLSDMQGKYKAFSSAANINPRQSALRVQSGTSNLAQTKAWQKMQHKKDGSVTRINDGILIKEKYVKGKYKTDNETIKNIQDNELKGVRFSSEMVYNGRISTAGKTMIRKPPVGRMQVVKIEIGNQVKPNRETLIDTILHEELEARIATRDYASDFYGRLNKMSDTERHIYINKVIEVAFRMKGLNYDLV